MGKKFLMRLRLLPYYIASQVYVSSEIIFFFSVFMTENVANVNGNSNFGAGVLGAGARPTSLVYSAAPA
jgi:hypothetical protein